MLKERFLGNHGQQGNVESADKSTLFLDEIAELTLEGKPNCCGLFKTASCSVSEPQAPRKVDVRIIAASNRIYGRSLGGKVS